MAWVSLGERHTDAVLAQDVAEPNGKAPAPERAAERRSAERDGEQSARFRNVCLTAPDATMPTKARNRWLGPAHK